MKKKAIFLLVSMILTIGIFAGDIPQYIGFVTDNASLFTPREISSLAKALVELESETGIEFAVLTVESLNEEDIDTFRHDVFNSWGIGKKGTDNGLLLVISEQDRKYGMEIGYGLEGQINDSYSGRIMRELFSENFRSGNYYEGVYALINTIYDRIKGEPYDENIQVADGKESKPLRFSSFAIFIFIFILMVLNGIFAKFKPGIRFLINFVVIFFFSFFIGGPIGIRLIISAVIALAALAEGGNNTGRRGHFYSNYDSGFGGSSGGFGGFGGGSSGGGGASGSW
ncbi:TPM domain-containing protein [Candidatus Calescamantes bacterium]|nr:TPM domain-containing protein [Candidatus Calescamantes bacterium]